MFQTGLNKSPLVNYSQMLHVWKSRQIFHTWSIWEWLFLRIFTSSLNSAHHFCPWPTWTPETCGTFGPSLELTAHLYSKTKVIGDPPILPFATNKSSEPSCIWKWVDWVDGVIVEIGSAGSRLFVPNDRSVEAISPSGEKTKTATILTPRETNSKRTWSHGWLEIPGRFLLGIRPPFGCDVAVSFEGGYYTLILTYWIFLATCILGINS